MTIKLNIMLLAAITVMMAACSKDEPVKPVNREWIEIDHEIPVRATPLLANYAQQHEGLTMWPSTVVDDSGLTGEAGDYSYWQEHKREARTTEELMAMCDISEDRLQAMSTPNLARTCYSHPYTFVYDSQNVIYQGFFFMTSANCYRELMQRKTGALELLNLYCTLKYSENNPNYELNALTLFLMTAVDYNALNQEQLARLSTEIFNKIDNIVAPHACYMNEVTFGPPLNWGLVVRRTCDERAVTCRPTPMTWGKGERLEVESVTNRSNHRHYSANSWQ